MYTIPAMPRDNLKLDIFLDLMTRYLSKAFLQQLAQSCRAKIALFPQNPCPSRPFELYMTLPCVVSHAA